VKALADVDMAQVSNPAIAVGDQRLSVDLTLTEGERLLCLPGTPPELIRVPPADRALLRPFEGLLLPGAGTVRFTCDGPLTAGLRVRATQDLPEELLLPNVRH